MRNHPIVNGKPTTFPQLAERLGIGKDGARSRYNRLIAHGPVTMRALRAVDRAKAQREKRDARIVQERQGKRRPLWVVAARTGVNLSAQRIQQIAGSLS